VGRLATRDNNGNQQQQIGIKRIQPCVYIIRTGNTTTWNEARLQRIIETSKLAHRNMGEAAQDQARAYNLRKRDWSPKIGDLVWERQHPLSKAVIGFAAKLAPIYDGSIKSDRLRVYSDRQRSNTWRQDRHTERTLTN